MTRGSSLALAVIFMATLYGAVYVGAHYPGHWWAIVIVVGGLIFAQVARALNPYHQPPGTFPRRAPR